MNSQFAGDEKGLAQPRNEHYASHAKTEDILAKEYAIAPTAIGIAQADLEEKLFYVNQAFLQMWGIADIGDVLGKKIPDFSNNKEIAFEGLKAVKERGSWAADAVARRKDGTSFNAHIIANMVTDANGQPICMNASFLDMTERVRMEKALWEYEEIIEHANSIILRYDRDGKITLFNKYAQNFFGYSKEEAIGKDVMMLVPEIESSGKNLKTLASDILKHPDEFVEYENENVLKDGTRVWVSWRNKAVRDSDGNVIGNLAIGQDVTERKKADQLKDDFIGMVSHELKTPLTTVIGSLRVAMHDEISSEVIRDLVQTAAEGADSLASMLENLLELSRVQAGRLKLACKSAMVSDLVTEIVTDIRRKISTHNLVIEIPDIPSPVMIDASKILIVLRNLIDNAIKYSSSGSDVLIFIRQGKKEILIGVRDQGMGMAKPDLEKLFQPFERLGKENGYIRGTGLGLVVCRRLIEAHKGRIWAESEPGTGSTFYFTLPVAPQRNGR